MEEEEVELNQLEMSESQWWLNMSIEIINHIEINNNKHGYCPHLPIWSPTSTTSIFEISVTPSIQSSSLHLSPNTHWSIFVTRGAPWEFEEISILHSLSLKSNAALNLLSREEFHRATRKRLLPRTICLISNRISFFEAFMDSYRREFQPNLL